MKLARDTWLIVPFLILFGIGYGGSNVLRVALVQSAFSGMAFV